MGMSSDEYWNQDAALVNAYRRAWEIRRDEQNFMAWLQGRYIYEAVGALAPILRTSLSRTPQKAEKYMDKPYPMSESAAEKAQEDKQKARMMAALEMFKREAETRRLKREKQEEEARKDGE